MKFALLGSLLKSTQIHPKTTSFGKDYHMYKKYPCVYIGQKI